MMDKTTPSMHTLSEVLQVSDIWHFLASVGLNLTLPGSAEAGPDSHPFCSLQDRLILLLSPDPEISHCDALPPELESDYYSD